MQIVHVVAWWTGTEVAVGGVFDDSEDAFAFEDYINGDDPPSNLPDAITFTRPVT